MKFFASKRTQRLTNFALAAMLVMSTLTASVPFLFTQKANAAPGVSYTTTALSQGDWTVDRATPSGGWTVDTTNGRVILNVNQAHASTSGTFYQTEGVSKVLPTGTDSIKADLYVAADWNTKPSLRVGLWGVAQDSGNTGPSYPIIEYANIGGYTGWRVWNANDGTWNNVAATTNLGAQNTVEIVSNFNTGNYDFYVNNVKVYSYSADGYTTFTNMIFNNYNAATGDTTGNYSVIWKNISTGTLPRVATCSAFNTYETVNLNNWDLSDTRATGHNQLVSNGLHVYTEGAASTDKAAGYFATNFALQDAGTPAINYASTNGGTPGMQLSVDFDNNGTADGILVGEPTYGNDWWLSNGSQQFVKDAAPLHTGGSGSDNHGTLNAWLAAFPNARVKSIGYSLGSGVYGDDVISSITAGCVNYTFHADTEKPVINTVYGTPSATLNNAGTVNVVASDNGGLKKVSFTVNGTSKYAVLNVVGGTTTSATLTKTIASLGLADGTYTIKAAAEDLNGNFATPKTLTITIDNVKPTITVKPESVGSNGTFSNVSFKLYDAKKIDRLTLNGVEKNLTDNTYSDLNGVTAGTFGAVEGSNTLVVYDVAGNATTYNFTIDVSAATPTLVSPADGASVNGASVTQSWSTTDTDINHYVYESYNDAAATSLRFSTTYTGTSKTATNVPNGTVYYWRVKAVDNYGNESAWSPLWKLSIDDTAPTVNIDSPTNGTTFGNNSLVHITGTTGDAVSYTLNIGSTGQVPIVNVSGSSFSSYDWDTTGLATGSYIASLTGTDAAGNTSSPSEIVINIDNTAPTVNIDSQTNSATNQPTITGTVNDVTATLLATFDGSDYPLNNNNGVFSFTAPTALANGTYTFAIAATDVNGNVTIRSADVVVAVTPPATAPATTVTPLITPASAAAVLGATTTNDNANASTDTGVKGTSDTKTAAAVNSDANKGTIFGLAWYWWILILAALAAIAWFIIAAIRRRNADEA
jgi:hypothetical protein